MIDREQKLLAKYFLNENWIGAKKLLLKKLRVAPKNHWLLTRLSAVYHEQRQYKKALAFAQKAGRFAPRCPLVLWDIAGSMDSIGKKKEAIKIWKKLVGMNLLNLAFEECGEGLRWAMSLQNDCRYKIAWSNYDMGRKKEALEWIKEHLSHRKPGLPSIYSLREVKKTQRKILGA